MRSGAQRRRGGEEANASARTVKNTLPHDIEWGLMWAHLSCADASAQEAGARAIQRAEGKSGIRVIDRPQQARHLGPRQDRGHASGLPCIHLSLHCQRAQKRPHFVQVPRVPLVMEEDVAFNPYHIDPLGSQVATLDLDALPNLIQQAGRRGRHRQKGRRHHDATLR